MSKIILLIHGRNYKPPQADLKALWYDALQYGIQRDYPHLSSTFQQTDFQFVYYGDLSNNFLNQAGKGPYDIQADLADRKLALNDLKQYTKSKFTKRQYKQLPGHNPWSERLADLFAKPSDIFGLGETAIKQVAPDMNEYWYDCIYGSDVRARFTKAIQHALQNYDDICVISHSLGSVIAYDVFWKLSYYSEYRSQSWSQKKVTLWLTLGSPLGNDTVKRHLKGARCADGNSYPKNIKRWCNFAAVDDYISHDQKLADDYKQMKNLGYIDAIEDKRIYNLSVRQHAYKPNQRISNPHHGAGYLIHPSIIRVIAKWI